MAGELHGDSRVQWFGRDKFGSKFLLKAGSVLAINPMPIAPSVLVANAGSIRSLRERAIGTKSWHESSMPAVAISSKIPHLLRSNGTNFGDCFGIQRRLSDQRDGSAT